MVDKNTPNPLQTALTKAQKELKTSIAHQERAMKRILELAGYLETTALNQMAKKQALSIIETCSFQDLASQKIRGVIETLGTVSEQLTEAVAAPESEPEDSEQSEISRLLAGEDVKKVKGLG